MNQAAAYYTRLPAHVLIVEQSQKPFWERGSDWDANGLPVPAEVLVYSEEEWRAMGTGGERFFKTVDQEAVWVYER